jgi:Cu-Zn family superoxide dismutase
MKESATMKFLIPVLLVAGSMSASAQTPVTVHAVSEQGVGEEIGTIEIKLSNYGLVFTPALQGLEPGLHGFHLHENPSCEPKEKDGKMVAALAAGGHYDPDLTKQHDAPWGTGHLGDLPPLFVDGNGAATQPVLAPRLKVEDLAKRAIVIHAGGDNHTDHPAPLGGGGARVACGVLP